MASVASRTDALGHQRPGRYIEILTRTQAFNRPESVTLSSPETPWAEYVRGFTGGDVVTIPGNVSEIYVRQEFGEPVYLSARHPCSADESMPDHLYPIYFMGLWHV
jgi:hypothetical protein